MTDKRNTEKTSSWEKEYLLNQTVLEWYELTSGEDAARRDALKVHILTLILELYDDGTEKVFDLFEETLSHFDPNKGRKFSHYFKFIKSRRSKDFKDIADREQQVDSLDTIYEDGQGSLGEQIAGRETGNPEVLLELSDPILEWTSMVLNFADRHQGQASNETRRNWYRIFYTEDLTHAAKIAPIRFLHERDMFQALKQTYLDYYMERACHTLREIVETPLKPYGEVVPGAVEGEKETKLPLPAAVSLYYLMTIEGKTSGVSSNSRSNYKKDYTAEKKRIYAC